MLTKLINATYATIGLMLLFQVGISGWRSTDGARLSAIQKEISLLSVENDLIREDIYNHTSMNKISEYATASHLQPALVANLSSVTVALNRK